MTSLNASHEETQSFALFVIGVVTKGVCMVQGTKIYFKSKP